MIFKISTGKTTPLCDANFEKWVEIFDTHEKKEKSINHTALCIIIFIMIACFSIY